VTIPGTVTENGTDHGKTFLIIVIVSLFIVLIIFFGCLIKKKLSTRRINRPIGRKSKLDFWDRVLEMFKSKRKKEVKYENFEDLPVKNKVEK
jgi:hypothetical protein